MQMLLSGEDTARASRNREQCRKGGGEGSANKQIMVHAQGQPVFDWVSKKKKQISANLLYGNS